MVDYAKVSELDKDKAWMEIKDFDTKIITSRPALNRILNYLIEIGFVEKEIRHIQNLNISKNYFRLTEFGFMFSNILLSVMEGIENE